MVALYQAFFGLQREPFSIAPDPRALYMSERHREALAHLLYGLQGSGGFVLLTGEIGAGKTTLSRCVLEQVPDTCQVAYLLNPRQTVEELLASICQEFGVVVSEPAGLKGRVDALNAFLLDNHARGRFCVLLIDEAQALSTEALEQLRLLTNLETDERKLLQIVLIGQPELRALVAQPSLEQLSQRVVARYHLGALTTEDTPQYVRHRMAVAGCASVLPFDAAALRRIHALTQGVPRRINLLCDRALLGAYAKGQAIVDARLVDQAAREVRGDDGPADAGMRPRRAMHVTVLAAAGLALALLGGVVGALAVMGWHQAVTPPSAQAPARP
jgi:general secretion pathway protein A